MPDEKLQLIAEGANSYIYYSDTNEFPTPVILKVLKDNVANLSTRQLYNEYEFTKSLNVDCVRKAYKTDFVNGRHVLYLDYFDGVTLSEYTAKKAFDIKDLLVVAIRLASALADIHLANIIHKDLNGNNILINETTGQIKIIDFGISSRLNLKTQYLGNPDFLEGSLEYISPEQTGRMNRAIDYRSDLYSLGVNFYEMFCGRLPFNSTDPMELVHCHIAKVPEDPSTINPKVSAALSKIIMKLLAKNAEDRYQSASGLIYDLEKCLKQVEDNDIVEDFIPGEKDFSGKFQISQKLYGREKEIDIVMQCFERVGQGSKEIMLVSGYSGVGKSVLVHEVHKPIAEKRGNFISGKFDQLQKNIPYLAIIQAFKQFVGIILSASEENLAIWKSKILETVEGNGKIIIDLIPEIELVIGKQPEIPDLSPIETLERFNGVIESIIKALARQEHPLVIFLDDLQWADSASLHLLEKLMTDEQIKYFMFIGAYRDNEVDSTHPLAVSLENLKDKKVEMQTISLQNLNAATTDALIGGSLATSVRYILPLSKLVYEKTAGNAFFVNQFMQMLYSEGLIRFSYTDSNWQWDTSAIEAQNITDNVVDLMSVKIQKMGSKYKELLTLASCIGNTFDLETLAFVYRKPLYDTLVVAWKCVEEGLLIPVDDTYFPAIEESAKPDLTFRFLHDRVQQAAYTLIPEENRLQVHYEVGKLMLEGFGGDENEDHLFEIANHLNEATPIINNDEQTLLASINLRAGQKAFNSNAFEVSLTYFTTGIKLLGQPANEREISMLQNLKKGYAEVHYSMGNYQETLKTYDEIAATKPPGIERAKTLSAKVRVLESMTQYNDAVKAGLVTLEQLGLKINPIQSKVGVLRELVAVRLLLGSKKPSDLWLLPEMTDEESLLKMEVMLNMNSAAYFTSQNLMMVIILNTLKLSIKKGNCADSAIGYAYYGIILGTQMGMYKSGYDYGELAMKLITKFNEQKLRGQVYLIHSTRVHCYFNHIRESNKLVQQAFVSARQAGDALFTNYGLELLPLGWIHMGEPMNKVYENTKAYIPLAKKLLQLNDYLFYAFLMRHISKIMDEPMDEAVFEPSFITEEGLTTTLEKQENHGAASCYYMLRSQYDYITGNYFGIINEKNLKIPEFQYFLDVHYAVYISLAYAAVAIKDHNFKGKAIKAINKNIKTLKKLNAYYEANILHKLLMVEGALEELKGNDSKALVLYLKAADEAVNQGFIQFAATALELAAKVQHRNNDADEFEKTIRKSYFFYEKWGAKVKTRLIEKEYPAIFNKGLSTQQPVFSDSAHTLTYTTSMLLDLNTVLKASTALSGEIKIDKLLDVMLKIVMENAGAQRAVFIILDNDKYMYKSSEGGSSGLISELPDLLDDILPYSIAQYVYRTKDTVAIEDGIKDMRFSEDAYIQKNKTKSILFIPIVSQGSVIAALYLENNLLTGSFGANRVELLRLLSGQIAISVENALLYENLENKVEERTKEINDQRAEIENQKQLLEKEKQISDELLLNILPAETAEELKRFGKAKARKYEQATVMFADIIAFTRMAELLSPEKLVDEIDYCFSAFDEIIDRHKIEKIKTIGDAYMCACGINNADTGNAEDMIRAVLEIQEFMGRLKEERLAKNEPYFELRTGVNTGPVVGGVVGSKKFAYDIWGDTVNLAARMEQTGEAGKVNISENTYELIKDNFECTFRGKVEAKNKGGIDMYFVEGEKVNDQLSMIDETKTNETI